MLLLTAAGCDGRPTDGTPTGTVRLFLSAMERANLDPDERAMAYALLTRDTRLALAERAHQAGALGGRAFEPWEMIVEGRFRLAFPPRPGRAGFREVIDPHVPSEAVVLVRGTGGEQARIPLRREDGRWRIALSIGLRDRPERTDSPASPAPSGRTPTP